MKVLFLFFSFVSISTGALTLFPCVSHSQTPSPSSELTDPQPALPPENQIPKVLIDLGEKDYFPEIAFVAEKETRTLFLWKRTNNGFQFLESHPIDYGKKDGDKRFAGDLRTPEGIYFFQKTYKQPYLNFNEYGLRAFTLNYPNFFDQLLGKTGSGIWLHGIPDTKSLFRGSRGCLVVRNKVILELENFINLKKTPIVVTHKLEYQTSKSFLEDKKALLQWIGEWKNAWESKDIDHYISFYDEKFSSSGMSREKWKAYKEFLNQKYNFIQVHVRPPLILRYKDQYIFKFLQEYTSDQKRDFGEKTLYVKKDHDTNKLLILKEEWKAVKKPLLAAQKKQQPLSKETDL